MVKQDYVGSYYWNGFMINVEESGDELVATIPDVPAGFEIRCEPLGGDRFSISGWEADGIPIEFNRDSDGNVKALQAGYMQLPKVSPEEAASLQVTRRMTAPPVSYDPQRREDFQALLDAILENPGQGKIEYTLPYPKHEFVQYVMEKDLVIFHGSNNRAIEEFKPVRTSYELNDRTGRGNLQAVYGTQDGLWSMFFAVVNRQQLRGSIRNGVMNMHNRAGEKLAVYNFSINQEQLAERPWTEGALYFLPRAVFERQKVIGDVYSNEWACYTPVKPLARLDLAPEDFPFLEQIGGHDDSLLIRTGELEKAVREAALSATLEDSRFTVTVPDNPEMAQTLADLVEIQRELMPAAQFTVLESASGLTLAIDDLPPAIRQVLGKSYQKLLES